MGEVFRAGLIAPDNEDDDPELEFIYDAEVDIEEMTIGEERVRSASRRSGYVSNFSL